MLHIVHMIERRYGPARGRQLVGRIAIASLLLLALGAGLAMSLPARAQAVDGKAIAIRALDHMDAGEYAQVEAMFDATMKQAVPAATLEQVWKSLPAAGTRGEPKLQASGDTQVVRIPLARSEGKFDATIAVDAQDADRRVVPQPRLGLAGDRVVGLVGVRTRRLDVVAAQGLDEGLGKLDGERRLQHDHGHA